MKLVKSYNLITLNLDLKSIKMRSFSTSELQSLFIDSEFKFDFGRFTIFEIIIWGQRDSMIHSNYVAGERFS